MSIFKIFDEFSNLVSLNPNPYETTPTNGTLKRGLSDYKFDLPTNNSEINKCNCVLNSSVPDSSTARTCTTCASFCSTCTSVSEDLSILGGKADISLESSISSASEATICAANMPLLKSNKTSLESNLNSSRSTLVASSRADLTQR